MTFIRTLVALMVLFVAAPVFAQNDYTPTLDELYMRVVRCEASIATADTSSELYGPTFVRFMCDALRREYQDALHANDVHTQRNLLITFSAFRVSDIASTQVIFHQGGHESNFLMPNNAAKNLLVSSAITVAEVWGLYELSKNHPEIAKWLTIAGIGLEAFATMHNVKQATWGKP